MHTYFSDLMSHVLLTWKFLIVMKNVHETIDRNGNKGTSNLFLWTFIRYTVTLL